MGEVGIDLTQHRSKSVDEIALDRIGTVITLCAEEVCPVLPENVKRRHWPFRDPAAATGSEEETLAAFRTARDGDRKAGPGTVSRNRLSAISALQNLKN